MVNPEKIVAIDSVYGDPKVADILFWMVSTILIDPVIFIANNQWASSVQFTFLPCY